jgi:hypothetical protein
MNDVAIGVERRRDHAKPAEQTIRPDAAGEDIEVTHPVQERQDGRSRTDGLGEGRHGAVEIVGLAAQEDEVERRRKSVVADGRRRRKTEVAERASNREASLGERRRARGANEKGHVAAGLQQPAAEIAAYRAGANDENPHRGAAGLTRPRRDRLFAPPRP